MFTIDTESGFKDLVLINASWGLGEFVVKGVVTPDEFKVFKPTLKKGFKSIISKTIGSKEKKLIYASEGISPTKELPVAGRRPPQFYFNGRPNFKIGQMGDTIIEDHYKRPMDIEWAFDGVQKELFIVQARPETVQARKDVKVLEEYCDERKRQRDLPGRGRGRENRPG